MIDHARLLKACRTFDDVLDSLDFDEFLPESIESARAMIAALTRISMTCTNLSQTLQDQLNTGIVHY